MPDNRFDGNLTNDYDDFESFDDYSDSNFDDFKYDSYEDYGISDETPLTSARSEPSPVRGFHDNEPLERADSFDERKVRPSSRREAIRRAADDQQNGHSPKPGVIAPDPRLAAFSPNSGPYGGRRLSGSSIDPSRPRRPRPQQNPNARPNRRPPSGRPPQKAKFAAFYIVLCLLAVGVCMTVVFFLFGNIEQGFASFSFGRTPNTSQNPGLTDPTPIIRQDLRSQTGMIVGIQPFGDMRTIRILDVSTRREETFYVPDEARIQNRFNQAVTLSELSIGEIVDINYDAETEEVVTLAGNRQARQHPRNTNVRIDIEAGTVSLGVDVWNFNSQTLVLYRGDNFPISQISPHDSVSLTILGDTVWLIQVDSAHGFLQILNADMIANGEVMIGSHTLLALNDVRSDITLPEGTHQVVVHGDNIEPFIENITIHQGQTTRLDLGNAQLRAALLHIQVTPADALIFVNGELQEERGTIQVEFGEVVVRVERDGFLPQEQRMDITGPTTGMTFNLVAITHDNTLVVFTTPTNAEIYIDNVFVGFSTLTHTMPPGSFTVVARLDGYLESRFDITITGTETEDIMRSLILMPDTGDPWANQPPPGHVEPIPPSTPTPPFPTMPPGGVPLPTPPPATDDDEDDPFFQPINTPPPSDTDEETPWWQTPPS